MYPTKVDFWLVLLLLGTILFTSVMGILVYPISRVSGFIFLGVLGFEVLLLTLFIPCRYTMFDDHLFIQSGIVKKKLNMWILSMQKKVLICWLPRHFL